jgi:hypothetical protein
MNNSNSASLLVMEAASPTTVQSPKPLQGTITSLECLRKHLQWAIELEHRDDTTVSVCAVLS